MANARGLFMFSASDWAFMASSQLERRVLVAQPENSETPPSELRSWVTPSRLFFVRNHFDTPVIERDDWRMRASGQVERELELDWAAIERVDEALRPVEGLEWISALRSEQIRKLAQDDGPPRRSLFDTADLAEIPHLDFPDERLIACLNPLPKTERARKQGSIQAEARLDGTFVLRTCAPTRVWRRWSARFAA